MQIKELKVTVGEVCEGYFNDAEEGVVGYDKRLDIRPKYQREFVYKDAQRDEVIRTVMKGLPLNVMYWCKVKKEDGSEGFEVLDGQQRTISLCEYVDGTFSVDDKYFYNLPADKKQQILDYPLFVYVCDGTDSEKLEWFRIINIAGEELTDQELRNAVYAGSWTFVVDGKNVSVYFGISRMMSTKIWEPPMTLSSNMMFEFDATDDYRFVLRLWYIGKQFIQFLCYRKNVEFSKVELAAPCENGTHETFAELYVLDEGVDTEIQTLKDGRYIKQAYISGHEGQILSDIASEKLYLRHLPDSFQSGKHIDAARFVMITAAFEWEFDRLFPDGICKSKERVEAELIVSQKLNELIDTSSGKTKKIYKSLLKCIERRPSLANKIEKIGSDMGALLEPFGQQLYGFNKEELNYTDMGKRLGDQRNYFAHGDLDKDFIGLSLLDLIFLQRIIYAIQLKISGLEDKQIQRAINDLFQCRFAI